MRREIMENTSGRELLEKEFHEFRDKFDHAMSQLKTLAVRRAVERTAVPIPPPPKCLYELGLMT